MVCIWYVYGMYMVSRRVLSCQNHSAALDRVGFSPEVADSEAGSPPREPWLA